MALHDSEVTRLMAFGVAGLSVAVDSFSAIKYAKVRPIRSDGIAVNFNRLSKSQQKEVIVRTFHFKL